MRDFLKKKLGVPDNWDKHDYQTQRYSFEDIEEVLADYINHLNSSGLKGSDAGEEYSKLILSGKDAKKFIEENSNLKKLSKDKKEEFVKSYNKLKSISEEKI